MKSAEKFKPSLVSDETQAISCKPLEGLKVVDLTRHVPGPYGTMLLADLGADVVVVGGGGSPPVGEVSGGKRFVALNLKSGVGREAFYRLIQWADVCIEGFRPGVTKRLGLDFEMLSQLNPKLIYCSLTGYGQSGPLSHAAGHDLNYLAISGVLGSMGPRDGVPTVPLNLIADMAGGGLLAAFGILAALHERNMTGRGRYVDVAMVDGCLSFMGMHLSAWKTPAMPDRGLGLMSGAAPFYRCYVCADGRYVAVGAIEPDFFARLWHRFELGNVPDHFDRGNWSNIEKALSESFVKDTRDNWVEKFAAIDACVSPVLDPHEAVTSSHYVQRFGQTSSVSPVIPMFSNQVPDQTRKRMEDRTKDILTELGFSEEEIKCAAPAPADLDKFLTWPPPLK